MQATHTAPRGLDDDTLVRVAGAALSKGSGRSVRLIGLRGLDGGSARNVVARATIETGDRAPQSVIVKATLAADHDPGTPGLLRTSGFAREWVALRLLDARTRTQGERPRFLAGDERFGLMVLTDLGDTSGSLVDTLSGDDAAVASRSVLDLAGALGELHAATIGCGDEHERIARCAFPDAAPDFASSLPAFERLGAGLVDRLGGVIDSGELAELARAWDDPGPWTALIHGDPCPDNALVVDDAVTLVDFEFTRPGHALHDATYWHMGFPSCWCAGAVPPTVREEADARYRALLAPVVPAARDDALWDGELARACALQLVLSAPRVLDGAAGDDGPWGTAGYRARLLHWFDTCAVLLDRTAALPGLRRAIDVWDRTVRALDGAGGGPLPPYRALRTDRTTPREADPTVPPP